MRRPISPRPLPCSISEFAELSDLGPRSATHNEDYLGSRSSPHARARGAHHGWLFALADGVGGTRTRRSRFPNRRGNPDRGFRSAPRRRSPHRPAAAPGASGQHHASMKPGTRCQSGRLAAWRPPSWPARCAIDRAVIAHVGRFPLLSDPPRPRHAAHPRPHRGQRAGPPGLALRAEAAEVANPPSAQPLARQRSVRQRRDQRPPGACRTMFCCFAPTGCTARWKAPRSARSLQRDADLKRAARKLVAACQRTGRQR